MTSYTTAVIKPGAVSRHHIGHIIKEASNEGLNPVVIEMQHWSKRLAEDFYSEHREKPFFHELIEHAISGPCVAMVLESEGDAVKKWRDLMGPTNPGAGTISEHLRTAYGTRMPDNAVHGSDDTCAAKIESAMLFGGWTDKIFGDVAPTETTQENIDHKADPQKTGSLKFKRLSPEAHISRGTPESAGLDLYATADVVVQEGEVSVVSTGIAVEIPEGHYGLIAIRSSLGVKKGINLINAPGIIDSDYRGEILLNLTVYSEKTVIKKGDRVAQLIVTPFSSLVPEAKYSLSKTSRGDRGFGSTGE